MKTLAAAVLLTALVAGAPASAAGSYGAPPPNLAARLERLRQAYPDVVERIEGNDLVLSGGERLAISDGRTDKSFEEMLDHPDIDDMFALAYPQGVAPGQPPVDFDPGRVRVEALFRALYGDCRKDQVAKHLRKVAWLPHHGGGFVRFTTEQGADKALEAISRDLDRLPASLTKFVVPSAGTYNCRTIAGTRRLSVHAFGAAIDVNTKYSAYWRWTKPDSQGHYGWKNQIPVEIVDIFEKHGFIWGGRWYHYDTMHFEYRPELLK